MGPVANVPTIPRNMDGEAIRRFWSNPFKYIFGGGSPAQSADSRETAPATQTLEQSRGVAPTTLQGLQRP
jgi:hypothetical protein